MRSVDSLRPGKPLVGVNGEQVQPGRYVYRIGIKHQVIYRNSGKTNEKAKTQAEKDGAGKRDQVDGLRQALQ